MQLTISGPLIVPLCEQALQIVREIHPLTGHGRFVFPSPRTDTRPMSNNGVLSALRMGFPKDEMCGHGFRSMASTLLHELDWPHAAIELQLDMSTAIRCQPRIIMQNTWKCGQK